MYQYATLVLNFSPVYSQRTKGWTTRYMEATGKEPYVGHLRIYGCVVHGRVNITGHKLNDIAVSGIFVGFPR